jgi:hypothetical protein
MMKRVARTPARRVTALSVTCVALRESRTAAAEGGIC